MIHYLLSWGMGLGLMAAIAATIVYIPSPAKRLVLEILAAIGLLFVAYQYGFATMKRECLKEAAAYELKVQMRDDAIKTQSNHFDETLSKSREALDTTQKKIDELTLQLDKKTHCSWSDADRKRLLNIR